MASPQPAAADSAKPAESGSKPSVTQPSTAVPQQVVAASNTEKGLPPPAKMNQEQQSCRLFLGNLDSDSTSKEEIRRIFEKYGSIQDVNIHRGFGFVQFDQHESLQKAILNEQGRQVGAKNLDLEAAKKKASTKNDRNQRGVVGGHLGRGRAPPGRGGFSGRGGRRGRSSDRHRGPHGGFRRSRSRSYDRGQGPSRRGGYRPRRGRSYSPPGRRGRSRGRSMPAAADIPPPKDQIVVKLILLGEQQREFADSVVEALKPTGIPFQLGMLDGRGLGDALRDCEHTMNRYACIIGRENAKHRKITTKLLFEKYFGRTPRTLELTVPELAETIVKFEREMGFMPSAPGRPPPNQFHGAPMHGYSHNPPPTHIPPGGYSSVGSAPQPGLPVMPPQAPPPQYAANPFNGGANKLPVVTNQALNGNVQVQLTPQQLQLLQSLNQVPGNQQQSLPQQPNNPVQGNAYLQQPGAPNAYSANGMNPSHPAPNNANQQQQQQQQQPTLSAEQMNDLSTLLSSINNSSAMPNQQQLPQQQQQQPQQQQQQYQQPYQSSGNNQNNVRRY